MEVFVRRKCEYCCNGLVQNPIWSQFWLEHSNDKNISNDETDKWFHDHGYMKKSKALGHEVWLYPPEEVPCSECEGKGTIDEWIDANELLKLLKV